MDSLAILLPSFSFFRNHPKTLKPPSFNLLSNHKPPDSAFQSLHSHHPLLSSTKKISLRTHSPISLQKFPKYFSIAIINILTAFPSLASESVVADSGKINLESIVVSIDDFFNRYPFFVAGCTFIWLVVIPLTQEYFRKYKFISAIDAFRKLRDDPNSQLLDIRDKTNLKFLRSPNLKILNKEVVQVEFSEGDEDGFVKKVMESFKDASNTVVCILDNFDGKSMQVAELLFNNGFKEAYAIRGGVRGQQGWMEIQETLLPPSVHMYPRKKAKASEQLSTNGGIQKNEDDYKTTSSPDFPVSGNQRTDNGHVRKSSESFPDVKTGSVASSSPYPNREMGSGNSMSKTNSIHQLMLYPDLKPPSSPTPSKPQ